MKRVAVVATVFFAFGVALSERVLDALARLGEIFGIGDGWGA